MAGWLAELGVSDAAMEVGRGVLAAGLSRNQATRGAVTEPGNLPVQTEWGARGSNPEPTD